jgi:cell division protein FtsB
MKRVLVRDLVYRSLLVVMTLFFLYSIIWSDIGFIKYYSIKREIGVKRAEVGALRHERDEIRERIDAWKNSPFYLEKAAREDLGMGGKSEVVYLVSDAA